jgi:hypothetical protein
MSKLRALILLPLATCVFVVANAQGPTTLQVGTPIERTLGPGQSHEFIITLEENTFVQLVVEQRGVDVTVKVLGSTAKTVGEYDTPNGNEGPEHVSFVAAAAGIYHIVVSPLYPEAPAGRYEIKLLELRPATEQEIKASKNQEFVKAKGLALVAEMEGLIAEIKSPLTRIKAQLQAAQLLWSSDEKRASKYFADATTGFKEYLASLDSSSDNYPQQYQLITELRFQIIQILTERDPDAALNFIYSSKPPPNPNDDRRFYSSQESLLEISIANQIARTDPTRALQIARQSLKTHYSVNLISTVALLRQKNPELASQFASDITSKLLNEKLLTKPEAASVVINLLGFARNPLRRTSGPSPDGDPRIPILSEEQFRDLLQKAVSEALSCPRPTPGSYSPERDAALNLLYGLRSFGPEIDSVSGGGMAAVEKKLLELNPEAASGNQYQNVIGNNSFEQAVEGIGKAPADQREQLYLQLANREANKGEIARARQIINERVSNPYQRRQALANVDQQEMNGAVQKGKVEDALRMISGLRTSRERAMQIAQIANQIGLGQKRATAIVFLEQAKSLLSSSLQAPDQDHMYALIEIARAFGKYDPKRSFEILDPLIDQVNDLCTAARTLEGFGMGNYEDDELNLQTGNSISQVVGRISTAIGSLALVNFERARAASDRLRLPEVRLRAYLEIAQQTIQAK